MSEISTLTGGESKMKRPDTRNITWDLNKGKNQWIVHVTKTFSVAKYKTKSEALVEAKKFREFALKQVCRKFNDGPYIQENVNLRHHVGKTGITYFYWMATYLDRDKKRRQKCFSVTRYGYKEALVAAIKKASKGRTWKLRDRYLIEDA